MKKQFVVNVRPYIFKVPKLKHRLTAVFLFALAGWITLLPAAQVYAETVDKPQEKKFLSAEEVRKKKEDGHKQTVKDDQFPVANGVKDSALGKRNILDKPGVSGRTESKLDKSQQGAERVDDRKVNARSFNLDNGIEKTVTSNAPQNYSGTDGKMKPISKHTVEDKEYMEKNKLPESFWERLMPGSDQPYGRKAEDGSIKAHFETLGAGGVRMEFQGKQFTMLPQSDAKVKPKQVDKKTQSYIEYKNVWPDVDLVYEYQGVSVKEDIVINKKPTVNKFVFNIEGAKVAANPANDGSLLLDGDFKDKLVIGGLNLNVNNKGLVKDPPLKQYPSADGTKVTVEIDQKWLDSQPEDAFPIVIDPAIHDVTGIPGGYYGEFWCNKSDGTRFHGTWTGQNSCNVNTGTLNDNGPKQWRTAMRIPYEHVMGRQLLGADLYLPMMTTPGGWGTYEGRTVYVAYATCATFHCIGGEWSSAVIGVDGTINVTNTLQWIINNVGAGGWLMVWGEEPNPYTFKSFNGGGIQLHTYTNQYPSQPAPQSPTTNPAVEVAVATTEPQMKVTKSADPNGDQLYYNFIVKTTSNNLVWSSGYSPSRQAIIPEGVLQDGGKYKWEYQYADSYWTSGAINGGTFRVDLLTAKDKAQTYDELGPVSVSLNNGNVHTSLSTHSISALGGDIGLKLDYNSPFMSKKGLQAEYFNNTTFAGNPLYRRVEPNIDQDWDLGSPVNGVVTADNYSIRWSGYLLVPQTGDYYFGGTNDDGVKVTIDGQVMYNQACYGTTSCFGGGYKTLTAGYPVPITVEYTEATGPAYATLKVKGAVTEQVLPNDWLRTKPLPTDKVSGLTGHYYYDDGTHTYSESKKFLVRDDPSVNFDWGVESPLQGAPNDNFIVKWEGYFTAPTAGLYKFGVGSDDGSRVTVNGVARAGSWTTHGYEELYDTSGISLNANQTVPILFEYFEVGGAARTKLLLNGPQGVGDIDPKQLSYGAKPLPAGWSLSLDAAGSVPYERLSIRQNGDALLYDSDGTGWLFTNTGSGFKPPTDNDGTLVKNSDASYTFTDSDGKIYGFNADGTLQMTSSPVDDRNPAALQYSYVNQNGIPRLKKITDAVNNSRFGTLYYSGDSECQAPYGYFDAAPPAGMLCGFATTDGQFTKFMYYQGNLALISNPGWEDTALVYEQNGTLSGFQDATAVEAVYSGAYSDPNYDLSYYWIWYDNLGRSVGMESPVPAAGGARSEHYIEYLPNATKRHVLNAPSPAGYHQYIEYDNLLRTTKVCDNHAKCATTEYDTAKDLVLSTTDALGQKTTTIYNDEDRPVTSYGPAPATWYGANREPLAAYVSQVPRTDTAYDENITGPAVAYYAYDATSTTTGKLFGGPKLHATGIQDTISVPSASHNFIANNSAEITDPSNAQKPQGWQSNSWGTNTPQFTYATDGRTGERSVKAQLTAHTDGDAKWYVDPVAVQPGKAYTYSHFYKSNIWSSVVMQYTDAAGTNTYQWVVTNAPATNWTQFTTSFTAPANAVKATALHVVDQVGWVQLDDASLTTTPGNAGSLQKAWPSDPIVAGQDREGWGMSLSGKLRLPASGTYQIKSSHDDGVKVWVDDQLVVNDWTVGAYRDSTGTFNHATGEVHRLRVDYFNVPGTAGTNASFGLSLKQNNGFDWTTDWTSHLKPGYGLATSSKVHDAQIGEVASATSYLDPANGIIKDITVDPAGIGLRNGIELEAPGAGFLRQRSKTLAGGTTSQYLHWAADAVENNPCTAETEYYKQAGFAKAKMDPDPDGAGPAMAKYEEAIYNDSGDVVASRTGNDAWTCTKYDGRGRVNELVVPTVGSRPGRTIAHDYAYGGNPLVNRVTDPEGYVQRTVDLLGRIVQFRDTGGSTTSVTYNGIGQVTQRISPLGTETYGYDNYGQLTSYSLDGVMLASTSYDDYGRVTQVQYPKVKDAGTNQILKLEAPARDALQRINGLTYTLPNGQQLSNNVNLSQSGVVLDESVNGADLSPGAQGFIYDKAGRLTQAAVAGHTYMYGFGAADAACASKTGSNPNAGRNANRMSYSVDGVANWYCYDRADRLIASSDGKYDLPTYDNHGNTLSLGTGVNATNFKYDQSDRNMEISQSTGQKVAYKRDVEDRITRRTVTAGGSTNDFYYGSTGGSNYTFMYTNPSTKQVVEKYIVLPGGAQLTLRPLESTNALKSKVSLRNLHGDTLSVLNGDGVNETGILLYEPFGTQITPTAMFTTSNPSLTFASGTPPANAQGNQSSGWAGAHRRSNENIFAISPMQMGARVYIPGLGRFITTDPVEGGTPNDYVYVLDPINSNDYSGNLAFIPVIIIAVRVVTAVAPVVIRVIAPKVIVNTAKKAAPAVKAGAGKAAGAAARAAPSSPNVVKAVSAATRGTATVTKSAGGSAARAPAPQYTGYTSGFKSTPSLGQQAHSGFGSVAANKGAVLNRAIEGTRIRPDAMNRSQQIVRELKPANDRGVYTGLRQLQKYMDATGYNGELWLYNVNANGTFNYFLHQVVLQ